MIDYYLPLILLLLVLAAFFQEDFVFTLLYLFAGAFALSRWWGRKALRAVEIRRQLPERAFLGEQIEVELELSNLSLLPVIWLRTLESIPVDLAEGPFRMVVSLAPHEHKRFTYSLRARKRGYYQIGPLVLNSGDILGIGEDFSDERLLHQITVFPKIVPLNRLVLPSRSPMGTLRHNQPIFADPSRVTGKRSYIAGDSLRTIDWKATATTGNLQVKVFEPSIALETAICLNLDGRDYGRKSKFSSTELAIVAAASIANYVVEQRQSVGLITNGGDPLGVEDKAQPLPPRKGREGLMHLLEVLARLEMSEAEPFPSLLSREIARLPWGTTLILITNFVDERIFDELFGARRSGMSAVLVLCGPVPGYSSIRRQALQFGFPIFQLFNEQDLNVWR